jgi:hypothetical protein
MTRLYPVYGIGWQKKIYNIIALEKQSSELDCVNFCLNLDKSKCNLFIMNQGKCFLGIIDMINGSILSDYEKTNQITIAETAIVSIGKVFV